MNKLRLFIYGTDMCNGIILFICIHFILIPQQNVFYRRCAKNNIGNFQKIMFFRDSRFEIPNESDFSAVSWLVKKNDCTVIVIWCGTGMWSNRTGMSGLPSHLQVLEMAVGVCYVCFLLSTTRKKAGLRAAFFQLLWRAAAFSCNGEALQAQFCVFW